MYPKGAFVFNQVLSLLPRHKFNKIRTKYQKAPARKLTYWQQFSAMVFAQMTRRESLRDLILVLNSHKEKLYGLGFPNGIKRSTLAEANSQRNWRIFQEFAYVLVEKCKSYKHDSSDTSVEIKKLFDNIFSFDSSTIVLNLFRYGWAKFRKTKGGVKLHTLYNNILGLPEFIHITAAKVADTKGLKRLPILAHSMYVFDRAYFSLKELFRIHLACSFFIVRTKKNLSFMRYISLSTNREEGVLCDQTGRMRHKASRKKYPEKLRRIKFHDKEKDIYYVYLTNNFVLTAMQIVTLYKARWEVELFFKWIKQHLSIKSFWGYSQNAVNVQIWTAISSFLIVYLVQMEYKIDLDLLEITQILSMSLLERKTIPEVFSRDREQKSYTKDQFSLF